MTAADFHNLAANHDASKAERLFRASVSAFCTLTRPSRNEVAQLDDLTLPLYPLVSVEARRFVAAALSECEVAPFRLVNRLAEDRVDIAAPLLMRSALLTDVDLIALIGRRGLPHARAIARRQGLKPAIMHLIRALEASAPTKATATARAVLKPLNNPTFPAGVDSHGASKWKSPPMPSHIPDGGPDASKQTRSEIDMRPMNDIAAALPLAEIAQRHVRGQTAEAVRDRLREMMRREPRDEAPYVGRFPDAQTFLKLRDAAFTGDAVFIQAALGAALGLTASSVRSIVTEATSYSPLLAALRSLDLGEEQAFMLAVAIFPTQFAHPEAIRLFATRYRALDQKAAAERVRGWKLEEFANKIQREEADRKHA